MDLVKSIRHFGGSDIMDLTIPTKDLVDIILLDPKFADFKMFDHPDILKKFGNNIITYGSELLTTLPAPTIIFGSDIMVKIANNNDLQVIHMDINNKHNVAKIQKRKNIIAVFIDELLATKYAADKKLSYRVHGFGYEPNNPDFFMYFMDFVIPTDISLLLRNFVGLPEVKDVSEFRKFMDNYPNERYYDHILKLIEEKTEPRIRPIILSTMLKFFLRGSYNTNELEKYISRKEASGDERVEAIYEYFKVIRQNIENNIVHNDPHTGNFALYDGKIILIDWGFSQIITSPMIKTMLGNDPEKLRNYKNKKLVENYIYLLESIMSYMPDIAKLNHFSKFPIEEWEYYTKNDPVIYRIIAKLNAEKILIDGVEFDFYNPPTEYEDYDESDIYLDNTEE